MSKADSAFPELQTEGVEPGTMSPVASAWFKGGLTKRELFAAMAMQGAMACSSYSTSELQDDDTAFMARISVKMADKLLLELKEKSS